MWCRRFLSFPLQRKGPETKKVRYTIRKPEAPVSIRSSLLLYLSVSHTVQGNPVKTVVVVHHRPYPKLDSKNPLD